MRATGSPSMQADTTDQVPVGLPPDAAYAPEQWPEASGMPRCRAGARSGGTAGGERDSDDHDHQSPISHAGSVSHGVRTSRRARRGATTGRTRARGWGLPQRRPPGRWPRRFLHRRRTARLDSHSRETLPCRRGRKIDDVGRVLESDAQDDVVENHQRDARQRRPRWVQVAFVDGADGGVTVERQQALQRRDVRSLERVDPQPEQRQRLGRRTDGSVQEIAVQECVVSAKRQHQVGDVVLDMGDLRTEVRGQAPVDREQGRPPPLRQRLPAGARRRPARRPCRGHCRRWSRPGRAMCCFVMVDRPD